MPANKVSFYNRIDMGIFLFLIETCLEHEGFHYHGTQIYEEEEDDVERVIVAKYEIL